MRPADYERNIRVYMGRVKNVPWSVIASEEHITKSRAYQIAAATEYQLAKGNPDYWDAYKEFNGSYELPNFGN